MNFEEWAKYYRLGDYGPLTIDDCIGAWEAATKAEREACAKVCEEVVAEVSPRDKWTVDVPWEAESIGIFDGATDCSERIRNRTNDV